MSCRGTEKPTLSICRNFVRVSLLVLLLCVTTAQAKHYCVCRVCSDVSADQCQDDVASATDCMIFCWITHDCILQSVYGGTCAGGHVSQSTYTPTLTPTVTSTPTPVPTATFVPIVWDVAMDQVIVAGSTVGAANNVTDLPCGDHGATSPDQRFLFPIPANGTLSFNAFGFDANFPMILATQDDAGHYLGCSDHGTVIYAGLNGIAETAAQGDDVQVVAVGETGLAQSQGVVTAGANGVLDTLALGDDIAASAGVDIDATAPGQLVTIIVDGQGGTSGTFMLFDPPVPAGQTQLVR